MYRNEIEIPANDVPEAFARFFNEKISKIVQEILIDPNVYNGKKKINSQNHNFMSAPDVVTAVKSLSIKNC